MRSGAIRDGRDHRPAWKVHLVTLLVFAVGAAATSALVVAATTIHRSNEERLLQQRVNEASLILTSAVPSITSFLSSAAELSEVERLEVSDLEQILTFTVGPRSGRPFDSLSVWRKDGSGEPLLVLGETAPVRTGLSTFLRKTTKPQLRVRDLLTDDSPRLGYAMASSRPDRKYVVYAESLLPADRTQRRQTGQAFEGLDYALYLGDSADPAHLMVASTPDVPLTGNRAKATVDFGDQKLLIAMSTHEDDLGGSLMVQLPWIIAITGTVLTLAFAQFAERIVRRRELAQGLATENELLYREQRSVAETLQRSLLPASLPQHHDVEFRARYEPGVQGIEVGGDWYDVVDVDDDRILLVVGDVSGRGLEAASIMASIRYAIRAHATQGDGPAVILQKLGSILQVTRDRHFATVVCVEVRRSDRSLRVATAGHPPPLLIVDGSASFVTVDVGPPVGIDAGREFAETTSTVVPGATMLLFTDGLFERRGEPIDESLERLRQAAELQAPDLDRLLGNVLAAMIEGGATDDTALLGVRWQA